MIERMAYFPTPINVSTANHAVPVLTNTTVPNGAYITSTGTNTVWTTGGISVANPYDVAMTIKQTNPPELEVKGRLVLNGQDLEERLNTIETVLQIPERDVILEAKHPKLKKMYDAYIKELSKYRMWEQIKGDDK
jgi:hypothetical protein